MKALDACQVPFRREERQFRSMVAARHDARNYCRRRSSCVSRAEINFERAFLRCNVHRASSAAEVWIGWLKRRRRRGERGRCLIDQSLVRGARCGRGRLLGDPMRWKRRSITLYGMLRVHSRSVRFAPKVSGANRQRTHQRSRLTPSSLRVVLDLSHLFGGVVHPHLH